MATVEIRDGKVVIVNKEGTVTGILDRKKMVEKSLIDNGKEKKVKAKPNKRLKYHRGSYVSSTDQAVVGCGVEEEERIP